MYMQSVNIYTQIAYKEIHMSKTVLARAFFAF
ncbi:hypothetical protein FHS80_000187 [Porphyromonas circumdentaria]|nr:hypothetical protein [Porphyromonas circumdentaria]